MGVGGGRGNFVAKHDAKPPASTPKQSFIFFFSVIRYFVFSFKYYMC